jgi:purine catabolism regulator
VSPAIAETRLAFFARTAWRSIDEPDFDGLVNCDGARRGSRVVEQPMPTVQDILAFPEVQRGHPVVAAARDGLRREVTWVHVLELSSVEGLLRGGEMVLLTGVALPDSNDGLRAWVEELAAAGASAAVIQLGERWAKLPAALVRAAERVGLPLVALHTVVPFVDITKAVLATIVQSSYSDLQETARVHELFHRMALEGRSDTEVLMAVGWVTRTAVVLENRNHHVLAFYTRADDDWDAVLRDWERRSRRDGAGEGWFIVDVRARGQAWGRLIALVGPDLPATRRQRLAMERGAENLALRRVIEGDGAVFEFEARAALLGRLTRGWYPSEASGWRDAEASGFPMSGRTVVGVAVESPGVAPEQARLAVARAASQARLDIVTGRDGAGLVSLPRGKDPLEVLRSFAWRLRREIGTTVIGLGDPVTALGEARGSMLEAASAARAEVAHGGTRPVVRLADVGVRGLLAQLQGDPRLQAYVERALGPLLDDEHPAELAALRAYLDGGRNKSAAAQAVQVSRPAIYARLRRAADLLGVDLDDAETCMSLQLALLAHEIVGAAPATSCSAVEPAPTW